MDPASFDIVGEDRYAREGYPHAEWAWLREHAPVWRCERNVKRPFWAITRHADVVALSKRPDLYQNAPRIAVFPEFSPPDPEERVLRHLLNMDPPEHRSYRKLTSHRFTPRGLERMRRDIEDITREVLDEMAGDGGARAGDFVSLVSAPLSLRVLAELLGVPRDMWRTLFHWTNAVIGFSDPEYQQPGDATGDSAARARIAMFQYFRDLVPKRRAEPQDDIGSVLATAGVDGEPLPDMELLSYYFLLVVAGNETTRNAMTGGLQAFAENPDQWALLRRNPELLDSAVEEIVRWTTPVIQFCRTPIEDVELHGQKIRAGENLCLFYPSANRDAEVFDAPDAFRIDRRPNRHVAFGIGEHFCLGANLARLELRVVFRHLAERLEHVEVAGPSERLRSSFVGGIKRLPIRYRLS